MNILDSDHTVSLKIIHAKAERTEALRKLKQPHSMVQDMKLHEKLDEAEHELFDMTFELPGAPISSEAT
jgi:hypothetical protein